MQWFNFSKLSILVDKILTLNEKLNDPAFADEKEAIQREIDATDTQIDEKVFALYGLTEKEKQIIEASLVSKSSSRSKQAKGQ